MLCEGEGGRGGEGKVVADIHYISDLESGLPPRQKTRLGNAANPELREMEILIWRSEYFFNYWWVKMFKYWITPSHG